MVANAVATPSRTHSEILVVNTKPISMEIYFHNKHIFTKLTTRLRGGGGRVGDRDRGRGRGLESRGSLRRALLQVVEDEAAGTAPNQGSARLTHRVLLLTAKRVHTIGKADTVGTF